MYSDIFDVLGFAFWTTVIVGVIWLIVHVRKRGSGAGLLARGLKNKILTAGQVRDIESAQVAEWLKSKLITKDQAAKLAPWMYADDGKIIARARVEKEVEKQKNVGSAIHKIAYFAVGCVVLGIISLIAANWQDIPDMVKLVSGFGLLGGCLIGTYATMDSPKKEKAFELFAFASIGLILGNIGLVGQIFHLGGTLEQALWAWVLLATPLFWISRAKASNPVWWVLLLLLSLSNFENKFVVFFVAASFPLLVYRSAFFIKVVWWFIFATHVFSGHWLEKVMNVIGPYVDPVSLFLMFVTFLYIVRRALEQTNRKDIVKSFDIFFAVYAMFGVFILDVWHSAVYPHWEHLGYKEWLWGRSTMLTHPMSAVAIAVMMIGLVMLMDKMKPWFGKQISVPVVGIICAGLCALSILFPHALWGACFTALALMVLAIMAARAGRLKTVNVLITLMFIRVMILYFHLFASLTSLGVSLVGFGIIVLLAIWFWMKVKDRFIKLVQGE